MLERLQIVQCAPFATRYYRWALLMMHPRSPTTMALHRNNLGHVTRSRSRLSVLLGLGRSSLAPGKLLFNACKLQTVPPLGTNGTTTALLVSLCPPWRAWRPCSNPKHFTTTVLILIVQHAGTVWWWWWRGRNGGGYCAYAQMQIVCS